MGKFKLRMGRINNTHTDTCLCSKNYSKFGGLAAKQNTAFELDSSLRGLSEDMDLLDGKVNVTKTFIRPIRWDQQRLGSCGRWL